jgi:type VI secretion system secreted protein Hcp
MAVADFFLKLDGIEGESQDSKHSGEMELESWSFGEQQSGSWTTGTGGGTGKCQFRDFEFVMKVNKAVPKLFLDCANGQHIAKGILTVRKAGKDQQEYLVYTFTDLIVSSVDFSGSQGENLPMVHISLAFAQLQVQYKPQTKDGTLGGAVTAGWNLQKNQQV